MGLIDVKNPVNHGIMIDFKYILPTGVLFIPSTNWDFVVENSPPPTY